MRLAVIAGIFFATGLAAFALFVAGRRVAGAALRVPGRLPPFGEAPLANAGAVRLPGRVAIAIAGPLAVYLFVTALGTLGVLLSGAVRDITLAVEVMPGGPAAAAGVRGGDRVVAVNGARAARFADLREMLARHPGETVTLEIEREGRTLSLAVTPGARDTRLEGRIGVWQIPEPLGVRGAVALAAPVPFVTLAELARWVWAPGKVEMAGPMALIRSASVAARRSTGELLWVVSAAIGYWMLDGFLLASLMLLPRRRSRAAVPAPDRAAVPAPDRRDGAEEPAHPPRPWVRAAARAVDVAIFWVPMTLVAQAAASAGRAMLAAGPLVYLVWAPLEAVLLATWGFTPGKWLLRVSVRDARGDRLDPRAALRRAVVVWTFGLAMSQTIGLVTGLLARRRLRRDGATYWDTLDGHRVTHGRIGPLRATIAVSIVALLVAAMVAAAAGTP